MDKKVPCPTCKKESVWSTDNAFRPFCSKRCQLIDFGNWADGSYTIPDGSANDEEYEGQSAEE